MIGACVLLFDYSSSFSFVLPRALVADYASYIDFLPGQVRIWFSTKCVCSHTHTHTQTYTTREKGEIKIC